MYVGVSICGVIVASMSIAVVMIVITIVMDHAYHSEYRHSYCYVLISIFLENRIAGGSVHLDAALLFVDGVSCTPLHAGSAA